MAFFDSVMDRLLRVLGLDFELSLDDVDQPFHEITPSLSLGRRPRPGQVEALTTLGITHVFSCLEEDAEPALAFLDPHFETLFLPVRDSVFEDLGAAFPVFFDFVDRARPGRVLVHCEVGVSRSATLATAYLMNSAQMRFYEAYCQVRSRRPQVLPNVGFATQLQRLEHSLFPQPRSGHGSLARYLCEVCKVPVEIDVLQDVLEHHDHDGLEAIHAIFGDAIPRVIQGVRR